MRALYLQVEGYTANFRGSTTVTPQLTFLIPPKSAVLGMVSALAGVIKPFSLYKPLREDKTFKEENSEVFVGIRLLRAPHKFFDFNLFKSGRKKGLEWAKNQPTQVELLVNPFYEFIVVSSKPSSLWDALLEKAYEREFFKLYLGSANCPAQVIKKELLDVEILPLSETETTRWTFPSRDIRLRTSRVERVLYENIYGEDFVIPLEYLELDASDVKNMVNEDDPSESSKNVRKVIQKTTLHNETVLLF